MIATDLLLSVFLAAIVGGGLALLVQQGRSRERLFSSFILIFLGTWAGGVWGRALFPATKGTAWIPFVIAGVLTALAVNALLPRFPRVKRGRILTRNETMEMLDEIEDRKASSRLSLITVEAFFWIIVFVLLVSIVMRYFRDFSGTIP